MTTIESEIYITTQLNFENTQPKELPIEPYNIKLRLQNIQDLYSIQTVIEEEEGKNLSIDEILSRVLSLYRVYVPFPRVTTSENGKPQGISTIDLII